MKYCLVNPRITLPHDFDLPFVYKNVAVMAWWDPECVVKDNINLFNSITAAKKHLNKYFECKKDYEVVPYEKVEFAIIEYKVRNQ